MRRRDEPDSLALAFGEAVRKSRSERGWTLDQLGEQMGASDGKYLGELERGFHSPTLATAKRIADALGMPLAQLVADL